MDLTQILLDDHNLRKEQDNQDESVKRKGKQNIVMTTLKMKKERKRKKWKSLTLGL